MGKAIALEHKKKFEDMKKQLVLIGNREGNYIKVELLFYEAMALARAYGENVNENGLLDALKQLQSGQYETTKEYFKKSSQKEQAIKRFMNQFKIILTTAIKNGYQTKQTTA